MYRYPNYDHLIAGLNSAIAQADQMDLSTAQTVDSITRALQRETEALDQIDRVHHQINQTGQVSIRDMNKVESIVSGTIDRAGGAQLFSFNPTTNNLEGAVEAINWAKIGKIGIIGAIVAAILAIIYKIFKFVKSGKVKELSEEIKSAHEKEKKSMESLVHPALPSLPKFGLTSNGSITIGSKPPADPKNHIDFDRDSLDDIHEKLRATSSAENSEKPMTPEEVEAMKRKNIKFSDDIPETTNYINHKFGTRLSESEVRKGFKGFIETMLQNYNSGKHMEANDEVIKEANLFVLNNVEKFNNKRDHLAIMFIYMIGVQFRTPLASSKTVSYRAELYRQAITAIEGVLDYSGNWEENLLSARKIKENPSARWGDRHHHFEVLENISGTKDERKDKDDSKIVEEVLEMIKSQNLQVVEEGFGYISKGQYALDEKGALEAMQQDVNNLNGLINKVKPMIEKLESNLKNSIAFYDDIIAGNGLEKYLRRDDDKSNEAQFEVIKKIANRLKQQMVKVTFDVRKFLSVMLKQVTETQTVLSYCQQGSGSYVEISETATDIAKKIATEVIDRANKATQK